MYDGYNHIDECDYNEFSNTRYPWGSYRYGMLRSVNVQASGKWFVKGPLRVVDQLHTWVANEPHGTRRLGRVPLSPLIASILNDNIPLSPFSLVQYCLIRPMSTEEVMT